MNHVRVAFEPANFLGGIRIPQADGAVESHLTLVGGEETAAARRERPATIGGESRAPDERFVALEPADQPAVIRFPEPQRVVLAGGQETAAVGRENQAGNRLGMTLELAKAVAPVRVPEADHVVIAPGKRQATVRR